MCIYKKYWVLNCHVTGEHDFGSGAVAPLVPPPYQPVL